MPKGRKSTLSGLVDATKEHVAADDYTLDSMLPW